MKRTLSSEVLKLRTLRSTWIVGSVAGVLSAIIGTAQIRIAIADRAAVPTIAHAGLGPVQALTFLVIGMAIVASAGEFQHRTIRTTLLLSPQRRQVLLAKSGISAAFGAVMVAVGVAISMVAAVIAAITAGVSVTAGGPGDLARLVAAIGLGALWSVLATALGVLTRSTAIALTTLLLWRFVGEGLLPVVLSGYGFGNRISQWTPSGAGAALLGGSGLPVWGSALVLFGYAGLTCTAAVLIFTRRDPA